MSQPLAPEGTPAPVTGPTPVAEGAPVVVETTPVAGETKPAKASDGLAADLAAERRKVKAMEKQLEDFQRAQMSEQEKLAADYKAAQSELETLRTADMRVKAAAKAGLPADLAARLQGSTVEEMTEDAKALKKALGSVTPVAGGGDAKAASDTTVARPSMNDLLRAAASGR